MRGRLGRYALWQMRDFAVERGIAIALIGAIFGYLAFHEGPRRLGDGWMDGERGMQFITQIFLQILPVIAFLGTMLAVNGIISNDRKFGYYKILFAKPVNPVHFYAQTFALHGAGFLGVILILTALFAILVRPVFLAGLFGYIAIFYLAFGGIAFLFSSFARADWLSGLVVWGASDILRNLTVDETGFRHTILNVILPPTHLASDVMRGMLRYVPSPNRVGHRILPVAPEWATAPETLWFGGYGLLCFALGLYLLRRRALAVS